MQSLKTFAEVEERVSDLVSAIVYVSPNHVIYEAESLDKANEAAIELKDFDAYTISKDSRWFVSVPL